MNEIPEPWATRLIEKGFTDPRHKDDRPSMSALAAKIGRHTSTISANISGKRAPSPETVSLLAEALGGDVAGWFGRSHHGPYRPPAESASLTPRQRKALDELIRSMTAEREGGGGDVDTADAGDSAPKKVPAPSPANQLGKNDVTLAARDERSPGGGKERDAEYEGLGEGSQASDDDDWSGA